MRQIFQRLLIDMYVHPLCFQCDDETLGEPKEAGGTAGRRGFPKWRRDIHPCDSAERRRHAPRASHIERILTGTVRSLKRWFNRRANRRLTLILPHPRHRYPEKLGYFRQPHFVRRAFPAFPGRPLLGRHAKRLGAFLSAAATGELLHPTRSYIPGDDFAQFIWNFTHAVYPSIKPPISEEAPR